MTGRMLEGKIVLVTGASSGIGRGAAMVLARYGGRLCLADINVEGGEETARMVRAQGGEAIFMKADVTQAAEVEALINGATAHFGRLDCAFNNAGIEGGGGMTADYEEEAWDHVINVNLKGVWLCMKYEIRRMLAQGGGAIVNTASVAGLKAFAGMSGYVASKHGVVGITKTAALEYAKSNIRINAVCPGGIRTPLLDIVMAQGLISEEHLMAMHPVGRLGTPEEVGEAVAWLFSDRALFVHGHALAIDGAIMAG